MSEPSTTHEALTQLNSDLNSALDLIKRLSMTANTVTHVANLEAEVTHALQLVAYVARDLKPVPAAARSPGVVPQSVASYAMAVLVQLGQASHPATIALAEAIIAAENKA